MIVAVRDFIANFGLSVYTLFRVVLLSRPVSVGRARKERKQNEAVLILNGPTFKELLENREDFLEGKDTFCVNFFINTPYYEQIKPNNFVIAAPEIWVNNIRDSYVEAREELLNNLVEKTTWPMTFFIPAAARRYKEWQNRVRQNPNIRIRYFNSTPVEGYGWFRRALMGLNMGMPRPHNVLIPSIYLGVNLGYQKLYLWGADHSWLPQVSVSADNRVLIDRKHFYQKGDKPQPMHQRGRQERRLHEVLHKFMLAFGAYHVLEEYAKSRGCEVYNTSNGSYIDAFKRINLLD